MIRNKKPYFIVTLVFLVSYCFTFSQTRNIAFEISTGSIVPNYTRNFPKFTPRIDGGFSISKSTEDKYWAKYFNQPEVGFCGFYSCLGNSKVFGNQISIYPYINFKVNNKNKPLFLKFGIGLAYFNQPYDSIYNTENLSVGSHFTWHFSASFYKLISQFQSSELYFTGGYYHASNGHTQIPNFGLNSALLGLQLKLKQNESFVEPNYSLDAKSYWVLELRNSIGFHELAATYRPIGGDKYLVFTSGFNIGYVHREHIKYKLGLLARYYDSYFNYIENHHGNATLAQAGNIYLMAGAEFLLGHVGIDIEGGLNLYKPFFKEFYDTFERRGKFDYWSKALFNTRMGLNYYLFDNYSSRKWSIKIGAHINANFGQADFSDVSLGFVKRF